MAAVVLALMSQAKDTSATPHDRPGTRKAENVTPGTAERQGDGSGLPRALEFELRAGAFPESGHPDAAVHVPPGFDGTRRPGVVLYFHGWNGCVATVLGDDDTPCTEGGEVRRASSLAAQVDDARVNALLVAVELRVDQATGDPGQLAFPGDARELLRELFEEHLARPLGYTIDVDTLDRVVMISHSGGYQAIASTLRYGGLATIAEVDLLDSLYGADDVFADWVRDAATDFDAPKRFVNLYTSLGGTFDRSRNLADVARGAAGAYLRRVSDDDGDTDLSSEALARPVVFKRVPREHSELPRAYIRPLLNAAGFARIDRP